MGNREQNSDEKQFVQKFKSAQTSNYTTLGQYIPIHKYSGNNSAAVNTGKFTSPLKPLDTPKFNIYEGDYICNSKVDKKELYKKLAKNTARIFKLLFFNIPFLNFFSWQDKQFKIKETLSKIESINQDVDKLVSHFEGKSPMNEQKYREICDELIRVSKLQSKIKKEIMDEL